MAIPLRTGNRSSMTISVNEKDVNLLDIDNSLLKNTYFIESSSIVDFDVSKSNLIVASFVNNQKINVFDISKKENTFIKLLEGYPEITRFLKDDKILVGSSKGSIDIFSTITKKRITFYKLNSPISSIYILDASMIVVGTVDCKITLLSISEVNKIEEIHKIDVPGIPVAFCIHKEHLLCAISPL